MDVFIRFLSIERVRETGRDCVRDSVTSHVRETLEYYMY